MFKKSTCPKTIIIGPLMLDPELINFRLENFPSNHSCPSPDAESHVEQMECHTFSLYSCPTNSVNLSLAQTCITALSVGNIRKSLAAEGVAKENRGKPLRRSVKNLYTLQTKCYV